MQFVSNQVRATLGLSSSLFKLVLRSRPQTKGVVSSTKLRTSISLRAKNKSFKYILKRKSPETDPCGTS